MILQRLTVQKIDETEASLYIIQHTVIVGKIAGGKQRASAPLG